MVPSIVMFHSVGMRRHRWVSPQISEDVHVFRRKLLALRDAGYHSLRFTDPRLREASGGERRVCLTFDDGYLDNWVHAFPVLQELGMQATIFVSSDFIDPRERLRERQAPDFQDDETHRSAECCAGFLSWPEMRAMEASGLVEIQAHARTHTRWFAGPEVVDFWHPGSATEPGGAAWMLWNLEPERKPFYLTEAAERERRIPYGTPIYAFGKALEVRRWHPDEPELTAALAEEVQGKGGEAFFETPDWRARLRQVVSRVRDGGEGRGEYESEEEREARMRGELRHAKQTLERGLGHEVPALVWPGGGVTPAVVELAREVGYRLFTLPGQLESRGTTAPDMLRRVSSGCRIRWKGRDLGNTTGREFLWHLRREEGRPLDLLRLSGLRQLRKLAWLAGWRPR